MKIKSCIPTIEECNADIIKSVPTIAWFPTKTDEGYWVWLEFVYVDYKATRFYSSNRLHHTRNWAKVGCRVYYPKDVN